jgi:hypothetical protein
MALFFPCGSASEHPRHPLQCFLRSDEHRMFSDLSPHFWEHGCHCIISWTSSWFFDKRNILISIDTKYIQLLQQRSTLMVVRVHTAKKERKTKKKEVPLRELLWEDPNYGTPPTPQCRHIRPWIPSRCRRLSNYGQEMAKAFEMAIFSLFVFQFVHETGQTFFRQAC